MRKISNKKNTGKPTGISREIKVQSFYGPYRRIITWAERRAGVWSRGGPLQILRVRKWGIDILKRQWNFWQAGELLASQEQSFWFFFLRRNSPDRARAASLLRFLGHRQLGAHHTHTHTHTHHTYARTRARAVGLLSTRDRPVAEAITYTKDEHRCLHRDSNPHSQQTSAFRPHGQRDQLQNSHTEWNLLFLIIIIIILLLLLYH